MTAPSIVRLARVGEEAEIFDFFVKAQQDNGFFPISSKRVINVIMKAVQNDGASIGVIKSHEGKIEAATGLVLETTWYSDYFFLAELLNFVDEEHRKSRHAHALLKFQKSFSDKMSETIGYKVPIIPGILTRKRLDAKIRLFQREFKQVGAIFGYNIDDFVADDQFNQKVTYSKPNNGRNATDHAVLAEAR